MYELRRPRGLSALHHKGVCVHVAVRVCVLEEDIYNSNANISGSFPSPLGTRHLCKLPRHFGSAVGAETAQTAACQLMLKGSQDGLNSTGGFGSQLCRLQISQGPSCTLERY